jgi:hypothetical protein
MSSLLHGSVKDYTGTSSYDPGISTNTSGTFACALDMDNGTLKYYKDNTLLHTDTTIPTDGTVVYPWIYSTNSGGPGWFAWVSNFGQKPFKYTPPSGYVSLSSDNLPEPTISAAANDSPRNYFNIVQYTGTGATQSITGVGFKPDFVWIKSLTNTEWHCLVDVVRGSTRRLFVNDPYLEVNTTNGVTSFDSDGFTLGGHAGQNGSGQTFVAYCWKAGGTAVTNNDGSIATQVSANTTSGFSIMTYTGVTGTSTIGHGLNQAPEFWVVKARNGTDTQWFNCHKEMSNDYYNYWLHWDNDSAWQNAAPRWGGTAPTDSVITIGNVSTNNAQDYVAYAWHSVPGFSKIGSYIGNGNSNGPEVELGFKPKFFMVKQFDTTRNWQIIDTSTSTLDYKFDRHLHPNLTNGLAAADWAEGKSNGLKNLSTYNEMNLIGVKYIYMAFAEDPFKYNTAR